MTHACDCKTRIREMESRGSILRKMTFVLFAFISTKGLCDTRSWTPHSTALWEQFLSQARGHNSACGSPRARGLRAPGQSAQGLPSPHGLLSTGGQRITGEMEGWAPPASWAQPGIGPHGHSPRKQIPSGDSKAQLGPRPFASPHHSLSLERADLVPQVCPWKHRSCVPD